MTERLQKLISRAGICSRRAAETLLTEGRVTVNGMAAQLGDKADPETDAIAVDGKPLTFAGPMVYLMLNKPRGYVTTSAMSWGGLPPPSWWRTAARGCSPWGGWTGTARVCCCSPTMAL